MIEVTLTEVKEKQPKWFSPQNKRFFGDVRYWVLKSKSSQSFLIQLSDCWSDMLGGEKIYVYRLHRLDDTGKIGELLKQSFSTMEDVRKWLRAN